MNNQRKHQQWFFFSYCEGLEFQWILNLASFKQLLCFFICLIITKWRKQTLGWIQYLTVGRSRWLKLGSIFNRYSNCILCFVFCWQPNRIWKYSFSHISANRDQAQFPQNIRLEKCIPNSLMSCGLSSLPVYGPANQTNMVSSRLIAGKHQVCDIRTRQAQCDQ